MNIKKFSKETTRRNRHLRANQRLNLPFFSHNSDEHRFTLVRPVHLGRCRDHTRSVKLVLPRASYALFLLDWPDLYSAHSFNNKHGGS